MAVGTAGGFTTYTVELAAYDLFPQFAVQAVSADAVDESAARWWYTRTEHADGDAPSVGGAARFTGVIFNDNGTLRMDCTQVSAGVTE